MSTRLAFRFLCASLLLSATAGAATFRVELDGTGDFTDIQPAIDAAAPGDTIRIGPGRFQTFRPCTSPRWTEQTIVWVNKDNLTFLGQGPDITIIGPPAFYAPGTRAPKGFCVTHAFDAVIRDLTVENIAEGIYWGGGRVEIENCILRGDSSRFRGIALFSTGGAVRKCSFDLGFLSMGLLVGTGGLDNVIEDCKFTGLAEAIVVGNGAVNTMIRRCEIYRPHRGVNGCYGGSATISNCVIHNAAEEAMLFSTSFVATIEHVDIDGGRIGIQVFDWGRIFGIDLVIRNTVAEPLQFSNAQPVTLSHSHLLPPPGLRAVTCYSSTYTVIHDLAGNWWGTTDLQAINDLVLDGNDDPAIKAYVRISPIAEGFVPVESTSWGDLKAAFR